MIKYIVDKIEGNIVVCEDNFGNIINIKKNNIKGNIKEGKVIIKIKDRYNVDEKESEKRKEEIENFMEGMWIDE